jgi:hypothetical protein
MAATPNYCKQNRSVLIEDKFKTPLELVPLSSSSPAEAAKEIDGTKLKEPMEDAGSIDLNNIPLHPDHIDTPMIKIHVSKGRMAKNPWFYAVPRKVVDNVLADSFFNWLAVTKSENIDRYVLLLKSFIILYRTYFHRKFVMPSNFFFTAYGSTIHILKR